MKKLFLFVILLSCKILIGQSVLLPSENIIKIFEKQYPEKKPTWTIEFLKNESDIYFAAKFALTKKSQAYAVYDSDGNFKSYKEQISGVKLPKKSRLYLDANYSLKSRSKSKNRSKSKTLSVREVYYVVDAVNKITYEVKALKDGKSYNLIFDVDGNLIKRVQII